MKSASIRGKTWMLNVLPATEGLEVWTKLCSLAADPIVQLGKSLGKDALKVEDLKLADLPVEALGTVLGAVLGKLHTVEVSGLLKSLLRSLHCDNKPVDFDTHFAGNYGVLLPVAKWALEINFSSFFDGAPSLTGLLQQAGKAE